MQLRALGPGSYMYLGLRLHILGPGSSGSGPADTHSEARQLFLLGWDVHFRLALEALQPRRDKRLCMLGPGSCVCLGSRLHRLGSKMFLFVPRHPFLNFH